MEQFTLPDTATIKTKKEIAKGTLMVEFDLGGKELKFKPGQYFFIRLKKLLYPDERGPQRHFTIVNSPDEKGILRITTRIRDSGFKKTLLELPIGTKVNITVVTGSFVLPDEASKPLVFLAGGIGITPFMNMMSFVTQNKLPYKITLFYSNRDRQSTAYFNEILQLAKNNPNLTTIFTMTQDKEWIGESRRIDLSVLKDYLKNLHDIIFYIAGPPAFVEALRQAIIDSGVSHTSIKTESFTGY